MCYLSFYRHAGQWYLAGVFTLSTYRDQFSWSPYISLHNSFAEHHLPAAAQSSAGLPLLPLWVSRQTFLWGSFPFHPVINPHHSPLGFTVYKGMSTYDYVKRQRQKEARNTEARNAKDAKINNKAPQVRPDLCLSLSVTCSFSHVCKDYWFSSFFKESRELNWLWASIITEFRVKQIPSCSGY